ncbi:MAG: hypothetical protein H6505_02575 [Calditrichaeota bacterium]|nr:hypothetical protein [Calditrichota bacterium]
MKTFALLLCFVLLTGAAHAQPDFAPVRLDPETDERFFFPTIEVTESNTLYVTWASANADWIGAYGREVDIEGNIVSDLDTIDIASTIDVSCPPRVEYRYHSGGAWAKMIYHE